MRKFYKTISLALALSLLQFFVPVLNVAMEMPCCEKPATAPCCSVEYPSRLVCCSANPEHAKDDAAPTQGTLQKPSRTHFALVAPDPSFAIIGAAPMTGMGKDFHFHNPRFSNNQRYKLLATFLI